MLSTGSPSKAERFIIGLGLGSNGQHITPGASGPSGGGGSNVVSGGNTYSSNSVATGGNSISTYTSGGTSPISTYTGRKYHITLLNDMCSSREVCSRLSSKSELMLNSEFPMPFV